GRPRGTCLARRRYDARRRTARAMIWRSAARACCRGIASSRELLFEADRVAHTAKRQFVKPGHPFRRAFDLDSPGDRLRRHPAIAHDGAAERPAWIDNDRFPRHPERKPAGKTVGVEFEVVKTWLDHPVKDILAMLEVDEFAFLHAIGDFEKNGLAVGPETARRKRARITHHLHGAAETFPDRLQAQTGIPERLDESQFDHVTEADVE